MALSVWGISSLLGSSRKQTSNNNGQKRVLSLESGTSENLGWKIIFFKRCRDFYEMKTDVDNAICLTVNLFYPAEPRSLKRGGFIEHIH